MKNSGKALWILFLGMKAKVRVGARLLVEFPVTIGVHLVITIVVSNCGGMWLQSSRKV